MRYSEFKIVESKRRLNENAGTTRISVGNTTYEVGNDLITEGGIYKIFSGDDARAWADANNAVVPPLAVIQAVYQQAQPLMMPIRPNTPTDTNAQAHHQQIIELNGQPSGFVAGHKKEIVEGPGTRIFGGRWPEGYGRTPGSVIQVGQSSHGGGHIDYSQGMRVCRVVEGTGEPRTTFGTRGSEGNDASETEQTNGLTAGPPYPQEDRQQVVQMQTKLEAIGYNVGETGIDGKYGPRTTRAVRAYKQDHNVDGDATTMTDEQLTALASAQAVENPTPTGNEARSPRGGPATGGQPGSLDGTAVLAANPDPAQLPNQNIIDALDRAASSLGIQVQITTHGGRASRDSGTQNHPPGQAADIQIVRNGNVVTPGQAASAYNELIQTLVANAAQRGVRPGIGGYTWGIHYDESTWRQGRNSIAGVWNRGFDIMTGVDAAQQGLA